MTTSMSAVAPRPSASPTALAKTHLSHRVTPPPTRFLAALLMSSASPRDRVPLKHVLGGYPAIPERHHGCHRNLDPSSGRGMPGSM